ncbi:alpha/beta hydrolase family protein [Microvirga makkahensis]|uniref:Alpha/beta fold hydrolase n=1 Tax=Microvirga makkahensis TaxID=1128670 RepID=A0A7X3SPG8_9HYPH|nr:alpha/beta fold hydrolase [Microvirga makkahensis]MXQ12260.1 alpha/beta fold hydrolase [Microvirga makkahensis]
MHRTSPASALAVAAAFATMPIPKASAETFRAGLQAFTAAAPSSARNLSGYVWYPTRSEEPASLIEDDAVMVGFPSVRDAQAAYGRLPLVVLSHGWQGNRTNQAWLAVKLAARGAVVAAIDHPGTTTRDWKSPETPKLWERARDVSRVIDGIMADLRFKGAIDRYRIAVIGHSMGGYTAMSVVGARLDMGLATKDCREHPQLAVCTWYRDNGIHDIGQDPARSAPYGQDLRDPRVAAAIALDPAFTGAMTKESLDSVDIPVLVVGVAGRNPAMDIGREARRLASRLPPASTRYVEIADASHFSFLGECTPEGYAILKAHQPGDEILCIDGDPVGGGNRGRDRASLHAAMLEEIDAFLVESAILDAPHPSR